MFSKVEIVNMNEEIKKRLINVEYSILYGYVKIGYRGEDSPSVKSFVMYLELCDGRIIGRPDWDVVLPQDVLKDIEIFEKEFIQNLSIDFSNAEINSTYLISFTINKEDINVLDWEYIDKDIFDISIVIDWINNKLPREVETDLKKDKMVILKDDRWREYFSELSHTLIDDWKSRYDGTFYVYAQRYKSHVITRYEFSIFLKIEDKLISIVDLDKYINLNGFDLHGYVLDKEDEFDDFVRVVSNNDENNYCEFDMEIDLSNESFILCDFRKDFYYTNDFSVSQLNWLKYKFDDLSNLPNTYSVGYLFMNPNTQFKESISKNFLVKRGFNLIYSRYQNNHVKVLTNKEIKKYGKIASKVFDVKLEPFLMTNTGSMFLYSKKTNSIYLWGLDENCMNLFDVNDELLSYLKYEYFTELSRIRYVFNDDLFSITLGEHESLFNFKHFSDKDAGDFQIVDTDHLIQLRLSGM